MNFNTKIKLVELKYKFDSGYNLTNYVKYIIAFFGLASRDVKATLIIALVYAVICFILGHYYVKNGWLEAQTEVTNLRNKFVKDMRLKVLSKDRKF